MLLKDDRVLSENSQELIQDTVLKIVAELRRKTTVYRRLIWVCLYRPQIR